MHIFCMKKTYCHYFLVQQIVAPPPLGNFLDTPRRVVCCVAWKSRKMPVRDEVKVTVTTRVEELDPQEQQQVSVQEVSVQEVSAGCLLLDDSRWCPMYTLVHLWTSL